MARRTASPRRAPPPVASWESGNVQADEVGDIERLERIEAAISRAWVAAERLRAQRHRSRLVKESDRDELAVALQLAIDEFNAAPIPRAPS